VRRAATVVVALGAMALVGCSDVGAHSVVAVTGLQLKPATSLTVGATEQLWPAVSPLNATDQTVRWASDAEAVVTVSSAGLVTAVAPGTARVTVTAHDGGPSASCLVTVTVDPTRVLGVTISAATGSLSVGGTVSLTVTIAPATAADQPVRWSTSDSSVASISSTSGGTVVVTGVALGLTTITATAGRDPTQSASCHVAVTSDPSQVAGVVLEPPALSVGAGRRTTLTATVLPSTAVNQKLKWATSDPSIASVSVLDGGTATVTGVTMGTATITATSEGDATRKASATVTVIAPVPVTRVSLDATTLTLASGASATLTASLVPSNATNQDLTWATSDSAIAALSSTAGPRVMVTSYSLGTATVTATTADGSLSASCKVVVNFAKDTYAFKPVRVGGGGQVTGVVFGQATPGVVFARTAQGGAFRRDSAANAWVPLLDGMGHEASQVPSAQLLAVESIAVDPSDSTRVYLASGRDVAPGSAAAIFTSTDSGNTFIRFTPPFTMGGGSSGNGNGERLQVDPNNGSILFFGSRTTGLYKSTSFGVGWFQVPFPVTTTPNGVGINGVVFDGRSATKGNPTQTIYVSVSQVGTSLYVSTNGGTTWQALSGQPSAGLPHTMKLDASGLLYVTYGDTAGSGTGTSGAVWRYTPGSSTWTELSPTSGTSFAGLTLDRSHPGTLMVTTNGASAAKVFRSVNGGTSWVEVGAAGPRVTRETSEGPWVAARGEASGGSIGRWLEAIEIDPLDSRRVMYVESGGLWSSENLTDFDSGGSLAWRFTVTGLELGSAAAGGKGLVSPPRSELTRGLYSVVQALGGFVHQSLDVPPALAEHFSPPGSSDESLDVAWLSPGIWARTYAEQTHGAVSTDRGASWTPFATSVPVGAGGPGAIAVAADGSSLVWGPVGGPLYFSADRGATWTPASGGPAAPSATDRFVPVADRVNPKVFYAVDARSWQVYRSANGGRAWAQMGTVQPTPSGQFSLQAAPGFEGHLWLPAGTTGLLLSTDYGASWRVVGGPSPCEQVGFGAAAPGKSYPAVFIYARFGPWGLFRSDDQGGGWRRVNDDAHSFGSIVGVTGDPALFGRVYLSTAGRGLIYGDP